MILSINPENPQPRNIQRVVDCLQQGGIIIYPTDTTYGLGCDIFNRKGVKKSCKSSNVTTENRSLLSAATLPRLPAMHKSAISLLKS